MKTMRAQQSGFTLPFVAMVAFGLAVLIFSVAESTKINTHQMLYFNNMNRVYRLAESGMTSTLGRLALNPNVTTFNETIPGEGEYESFATLVSSPIYNTFYVVTSATRTSGGKSYASKLHTYASVANIGEYFAVFETACDLSPGIDASGGKIYAPFVTFRISNTQTAPTRVHDVEYVHSALALDAANASNTYQPADWATANFYGSPITPGKIFIGTNSVSELPRKLGGAKRLPTVSDRDLDRYETALGGSTHNHLTHIFGNVYPPGYVGNYVGPPDLYHVPMNYHTNTNSHHVYYSPGEMRIGTTTMDTTIFGQVLFVARGDIYIEGNIRSADIATYPTFPGAGSDPVIHVDSSTAHQAVFITPGDIIFRTAELATVYGSTITLQGLLYAPKGQIYVNPNTMGLSPSLTFNFTGAQFLSGTAGSPNNLPSQFGWQRTYSYMSTLRTNPPPYLPAMITLYYSFEDISLSPSMY